MQIIGQKEFVAATLDLGKEAFIVQIIHLETTMSIYRAWKALITSLLAKKVNIPVEYLDFTDMFLKKLATKISKRSDTNKHLINLEINKQLPYRPTYSLEPVKLEILKTYIKINLANCFIRPFKFLAGSLILFVKKPNSSLRLCINYQDLNNLTIKNWYLLLLIGELLGWLDHAKQFI